MYLEFLFTRMRMQFASSPVGEPVQSFKKPRKTASLSLSFNRSSSSSFPLYLASCLCICLSIGDLSLTLRFLRLLISLKALYLLDRRRYSSIERFFSSFCFCFCIGVSIQVVHARTASRVRVYIHLNSCFDMRDTREERRFSVCYRIPSVERIKVTHSPKKLLFSLLQSIYTCIDRSIDIIHYKIFSLSFDHGISLYLSKVFRSLSMYLVSLYTYAGVHACNLPST